MAKLQDSDQKTRIARYRVLAREVTDPLAVCLLREIVEELEAALEKDEEIDRPHRSW
jgi:hypothetical protein